MTLVHMNPEEASRGSRDRSDQGRGDVYVCEWGRDVWEDGVGMGGDDPGAHEPRGGVTGAPETGQSRGRARRCMCGMVG